MMNIYRIAGVICTQIHTYLLTFLKFLNEPIPEKKLRKIVIRKRPFFKIVGNNCLIQVERY